MTSEPSDSPSSDDDATRWLILMRHAKSDWADHSLSDHDRPLNKRGRGDAPKMAVWLAKHGAVADMVLCSSSQRTRETLQRMNDQWDPPPQVSYSESLYLATPEMILRTIRSDACGALRVMVIAHNPGISHLVSMLADQLIEMPTAGIAVFRLELDDWGKLSSSTPRQLVQFVRPKEL